MKKKASMPENSRRDFMRNGSLLLASVAVTGFAVSCDDQKKPEKEKKEEPEEIVSPNEDLMREHGLLQRMMLVYDSALVRLKSGEGFNPTYINQTATIVRNFIEDYHEKLEEDYLFPRLVKANRLTELVNTLLIQHKSGRKVTAQILAITKNGRLLKPEEAQQLQKSLQAFNTMYRPHEAREDTVLFPAFKEVVSTHEYASLGEDFEKIEHKKFGEGGFDTMVDTIAEIEKQIGIYDLSQFTPQV